MDGRAAPEADSKQEEATMKKSILYGLASALVTALAIKAAPALAQDTPAGEIAVAIVKTADIDLGSATGQHQLDRRLAQAVRDVCGTASEADLKGKNEVRSCRDDTLARARADKDAVLAAARRGALIAVSAAR